MQFLDAESPDLPGTERKVKVSLQELFDLYTHQGVQAQVCKGAVWVQGGGVFHSWGRGGGGVQALASMVL